MILIGENPIRGPLERVGPENQDVFGPWNGQERSECHLGPKKTNSVFSLYVYLFYQTNKEVRLGGGCLQQILGTITVYIRVAANHVGYTEEENNSYVVFKKNIYWSAGKKCGGEGGKELLHRKIRLIENNAKCRYLTKLTFKGTSRQAVICLRPPPLLGFFGGMVLQILYVLHLVRNRVLNSSKILSPTQLNTPPPRPLPATHCLYMLYFDFGKGGRVGEVNHREG